MTSNFEKVREFHQVFGHPINLNASLVDLGKEGYTDATYRQLRIDLLWEEVIEFRDAIGSLDIIEAADAIGDILYVAYGAAHVLGIQADRVLAEVHRSNMTKLGSDGKPIYREDGKVMKGPDYEKPDIAMILAKYTNVPVHHPIHSELIEKLDIAIKHAESKDESYNMMSEMLGKAKEEGVEKLEAEKAMHEGTKKRNARQADLIRKANMTRDLAEDQLAEAEAKILELEDVRAKQLGKIIERGDRIEELLTLLQDMKTNLPVDGLTKSTVLWERVDEVLGEGF